VKKLFLLFLSVMLIAMFCIPQVAGEANKILINMQIGSKTAYVNGSPISLDVPPQITNGRTLVPIRFVSENLGADVGWDGTTKTVTITMDSIPYLNNKISSLEIEKSSLTTRNGALQEKATTLEIEKANLVTQNSVLQQRIDELEEETSGGTPSQIAAQNSQNVVYIETNVSLGSGFLATTDGKVVTNYHVIKDASTATVKLSDGRVFTLNGVVNYDETRDIAVLQLPLYNTQSVTLGDSNQISDGDEIVVIGNPLGLQNSVTTGVVSATNRIIENENWIQISAPISPGSSGGPVFNANGEVIGVTTWGFVGEGVQGLNFAIPINDVKTLLSYNKPATFSELLGSGTSTSTNWILTQDEVQSAINWGKANKDYSNFIKPFEFGSDSILKTSGHIATPYYWVAIKSREKALIYQDITSEEAQYQLQLFGDKALFFVTVLGDSIDFAKDYHATVKLGNKTIQPYQDNNQSKASETLLSQGPLYFAVNYYWFFNADIPRDAVITLIIADGHGGEEQFVIDLSEIP